MMHSFVLKMGTAKEIIPSKLEVAPYALKMSDWMEWMDGVGDTP